MKIISSNINCSRNDYANDLIDTRYLEKHAKYADLLCLQELPLNAALNITAWRNLIGATIGKTATCIFEAGKKVGVIALGEDIKVQTLTEHVKSDRILSIRVTRANNAAFQFHDGAVPFFFLLVVYAPVDPKERRAFFSGALTHAIESLATEKGPLYILGDFNDVPATLDEKSTARFRDTKRYWSTLRTHLDTHSITDLYRLYHPQEIQFSYRRPRDVTKAATSQRRIDHALGNLEASRITRDVSYVDTSADCGRMDHWSIIVHIDESSGPEVTKKRHTGKAWRLQPDLLKNKELIEALKSYLIPQKWEHKTSQNQIPYIIEITKFFLIKYLTKHRTGHMISSGRRALEANQAALHAPPNQDLTSGGKTLEDVADGEAWSSSSLRSRSIRTRVILEESRPTILTRDAISSPKVQRTTLERLRNPEDAANISTDAAQIREWIALFYKKLYTPTDFVGDYEADSDAYLRTSDPVGDYKRSFGSSQRKKLGEDFSAFEIAETIEKANMRSVAGKSGLPYQFWATFSEILSPSLRSLAQHMMKGGALKPGCPEIEVTILHKKGDTEDIKNYRPISLIDTHFRVLFLAVVRRIGRHIRTVIPDAQTGFIPQRNMMTNVITIAATMECARNGWTRDTDPAFLCLDQEKAYDRVRREWIWKVMAWYKFPHRLISMFQAYYRGATTSYRVNGALTTAITQLCGLMQGDPASTLIYVICLQPLLNNLSNRGVGVTIGHRNCKDITIPYVAYADDTWVFISDRNDLTTFRGSLDEYCRLSNAKINETKSYAGSIKNDARPTWLDGENYIPAPMELDVLGIPMRRDGSPPTASYRSLLASLTNGANTTIFQGRPLLGKVAIVNTLLTSRLWYALSFGPLTPEVSKDVREFMATTLFSIKRCPVRFDIVCLPKYLGGLNLLHPEHHVLALQGKWIINTLGDPGQGGRVLRTLLAISLEELLGLTPIYALLPRATKPKDSRMTTSPMAGHVLQVIRSLGGVIHYEEQQSEDDPLSTLTLDQALSLPWNPKHVYFDGYQQWSGRQATPEHMKLIDEHLGGTLRDVVWWDNLQQSLVTPEQVKLRESTGLNRADRKRIDEAWRAMRLHIQHSLTTCMPPAVVKLMARRAIRPELCNSFGPASMSPDVFYTRKDLDLCEHIPWGRMKLAGMSVASYTVKRARVYSQLRGRSPEDIQCVESPEHADTTVHQAGHVFTKADWRRAWLDLHWTYRPVRHASEYWRLLHNRIELARDRSDSSTATGGSSINHPGKSFSIMKCLICGISQDSVQHSWCECEAVQGLWEEATELLLQTLEPGSPAHTFFSQREASISFRDVLFCFPDTIGDTLRNDAIGVARVRLWHSCVLHTITELRARSFRKAKGDARAPRYNFRTGFKDLEREYFRTLVEVYLSKDAKDRVNSRSGVIDHRLVEKFLQMFIQGNSRTTRIGKTFKFHWKKNTVEDESLEKIGEVPIDDDSQVIPTRLTTRTKTQSTTAGVRSRLRNKDVTSKLVNNDLRVTLSPYGAARNCPARSMTLLTGVLRIPAADMVGWATAHQMIPVRALASLQFDLNNDVSSIGLASEESGVDWSYNIGIDKLKAVKNGTWYEDLNRQVKSITETDAS